MWAVLAKVALPFVLSIFSNVSLAEKLIPGKKSGKEKEKFVLESVVPIVNSLTSAGVVQMPADEAIGYIRDVVKGIVAALNLFNFFKRSS